MKYDYFPLFCLLSAAIIFCVCIGYANHRISNLQEQTAKLERDVDNYKANWEPINRGVALTPKEIRRLRQLCRCK